MAHTRYLEDNSKLCVIFELHKAGMHDGDPMLKVICSKITGTWSRKLIGYDGVEWKETVSKRGAERLVVVSMLSFQVWEEMTNIG